MAQRQEQIIIETDALDRTLYAEKRMDFLRRFGWNDTSLEALPAHASYRRYYRVCGGKEPALLMDATLDVTEPLMWFVTVDRHLQNLGLTVPKILHYEVADDCSLALIEDLGDKAYDCLIDQGQDPIPLYEKAIDVLAYLHNQPAAADVDVPEYTLDKMLTEVDNTVNWYMPAVKGRAASKLERQDYREIWTRILTSMPPIENSLVLFDYIFNNMMHIDGREGIESCGLLDFQAARIGPTIYDVVSLLEDIRRDLAPADFRLLRGRYLEQVKVTQTEEDFDLWFSVMTTQRHCKNLGNLVRLFVRDGKPELLQYIPRMRQFVWQHLQKPVFAELKNWFEQNYIDLTKDLEKGFEHADGYPEK